MPIGVTVVGAVASLAGGCGLQSRDRAGRPHSTLTIYTTAAQAGPDSQEAVDAIDAERLALSQIGNRLGQFQIHLITMNDASPTGQWSARQTAGNAQRVAQDPTAIAYITDATPGTPTESIDVLDRAGILQINAGETMQNPRDAAAPSRHPSLLVRFGPSQAAEANSELELLKTQHISRLLVLDDGTAYGRASAQAVTRRARAFNIKLVQNRHPVRTTDRNLRHEIAASKPQAIFLGGLTGPTAIAAWDRIAAAAPRMALLGPSGLDTPEFAAAITVPAQPKTFLDEPGLPPTDLPPAGVNFLADFAAAYGHAPTPAAFFGYAATQAVLDAIHTAGRKAKNKAVIAKTFVGLRAIPSVLGTYSINNTTATITPSFIFSTIKNGKRDFDRIVIGKA